MQPCRTIAAPGWDKIIGWYEYTTCSGNEMSKQIDQHAHAVFQHVVLLSGGPANVKWAPEISIVRQPRRWGKAIREHNTARIPAQV